MVVLDLSPVPVLVLVHSLTQMQVLVLVVVPVLGTYNASASHMGVDEWDHEKCPHAQPSGVNPTAASRGWSLVDDEAPPPPPSWLVGRPDG